MCISAVCVSAYVYSNSKLERILFLISNCFLIVCCLFEHHLQNNSAILGTKSKDIWEEFRKFWSTILTIVIESGGFWTTIARNQREEGIFDRLALLYQRSFSNHFCSTSEQTISSLIYWLEGIARISQTLKMKLQTCEKCLTKYSWNFEFGAVLMFILLV